MNATSYVDDLALELRLLDVPGTKIGEILAEVQAHVAETGEDPREAFGPVKDYAAERARAAGTAVGPDDQKGSGFARLFRGHWLMAIGGFLYTALAAFFLINGVLALLWDKTEPPFGIPPWASIALGVILFAAWSVSFMRLVKKDRIIDPRTGREVQWDAKGRMKPE
ncbi:MAG: hypothetical protein Q4G35_07075 [Propionibacteriaceae bacterium]|nr:hypothetical protein [Propionibacteriaceae bacterium]